MAEKSISLDSLLKKQLIRSVYDKNDQIVLEEGTIVGSADLVLLKTRDIPLEKIKYTEPLKCSERNTLLDRLEGEILLEFDYPSPEAIPGRPGQMITPDLLKEIRKLKICPSYYLKRTFRGAPFDMIAPVKDPENNEVLLSAGEKFTLGILKSLVRSGFHIFDFIPRAKNDTAVTSLCSGDELIAKGIKLDKRHISKLKYASIDASEPPGTIKQKCKKNLIAPDKTLLAVKQEKITYSMLSRIREKSLTSCRPDIYSYLEGKTCPVPIIRIADKREELKSVDLLRLFQIKGFDISMLYRHFGNEELAHWFDPFLDLVYSYFGGGRIVQKCGSPFDPMDPLREYNGLIKFRLTEDISDAPDHEEISRSSRIEKMTDPKIEKLSKNAKEKIEHAGGRFVALLCIIESKRKTPTVYYHTTLRSDIPAVKHILTEISMKMGLESGLRIQEGKLF